MVNEIILTKMLFMDKCCSVWCTVYLSYFELCGDQGGGELGTKEVGAFCKKGSNYIGSRYILQLGSNYIGSRYILHIRK